RKYEEALSNYDASMCMIEMLEGLGHHIPLKPKKPAPPPMRRDRVTSDKVKEFQRRTIAQNELSKNQLDTKIREIKEDSGRFKKTNPNSEPTEDELGEDV